MRVLNPFVFRQISSAAKEYVLDVGCGVGFWGYFVRRKKGGDSYIIGVDVYKPYLDYARSKCVYDELVVCDAGKLPFRDDSFDLVIASEVIEHLPKQKGIELLADMERICRGKIIVTTPNGYLPQDSLIESDVHRSQWYVKDFRLRKFRVRGLALKMGRTAKGHTYFWVFFSTFFTPLSYVFPNAAGLLVATKNMEEEALKPVGDPEGGRLNLAVLCVTTAVVVVQIQMRNL